MSRHAWVYIWSVLLTGTLLGGLAFTQLALPSSPWHTFIVLVALATCAQLFKVRAPNYQLYHVTTVFLFAGVFLLPPPLYVFLVIIPHLIEWARERWIGSPYLQAWYVQPFNIAVHITAGMAAGWIATIVPTYTLLKPSSLLAVTTAALIYVLLNHGLIGGALALTRGVSISGSGILDFESLLTDFVLLSLGAIAARLWSIDPWLTALVIGPLVLIYRALMIPQLQEEARVDGKTGLWNARHFLKAYSDEFLRASRFDRPLSLIMADLDLLRNINNTYGHLAGDAVLARIGQIIRENIRPFDIAGRFGGEEFAIALLETGPAEAQCIAERIRQAVEATNFQVATSPTPIRVTLSLGIASFPEDALSPEDLVHQADIAVYQAKLLGRNCVINASDVPEHLDSNTMSADRLPSYAAALIPRSTAPVTRSNTTPDAAGAATHKHTWPTPTNHALGPSTTPVAANSTTGDDSPGPAVVNPWLWAYVGTVVAVGVVLALAGFLLTPLPDPVTLALLVGLATVAEALQLDLYGDGSISVSAATAFTSALVAGMPAVVCASIAVVLVHYWRRRPRLYQTVFNWATHVLAGAPLILTIQGLSVPLYLSNLPLLAVPAVVAALAYYVIETGLIAGAIGLSERTGIVSTWRSQYRWLATHYLVLCILGLFLAIAYTTLGVPGVFVFALPLFMMRYAQKQYIDRTVTSVHELKRMNAELARANREIIAGNQAIQRLNGELSAMNEELFLTLAKIIDARDPYVHGHAIQVANYARAIASELGLPADQVELIRQAAFLHDIGKIGISEAVLHKPGKLTKDEYEYVKTHVTIGADFLETCRGLRHLASFVRHHHEWWDGRGYPDGLQGEEIPLEARILAVCDAVEAMASDRPYHRAMALDEILAELQRCSGTQFDPAIVEAFIKIVEQEGEDLVINSACEVDLRQADTWPAPFSRNGGLHPSTEWSAFKKKAELAS